MFASDRDGTSARRPVCTLAMRSEDTKRSFLKSSGHVSYLKMVFTIVIWFGKVA